MRSAALLRVGLAAALLLAAGGCAPPRPEGTVRVGHFPNVTHAHGLLGHSFSREGKGWFEERLPPGTKVEWFVYNAGPGAMESLVSGSLDLVYVGPSPALNAHVRSGGEEVRVLSGATRGGAALVVRGDRRIAGPRDLAGTKVATPELGNTQDVACRHWLLENGLRVTVTGGDLHVLPTENPDALVLMRSGEIDAAWTVEPWVSRLVGEAGGRVLVEDGTSLTTILVARAGLLQEEPAVVAAFVAAHRDLTRWISKNPEEARERIRAELREETTRPMPKELLDRCWPRLRFDDFVERRDFEHFVSMARKSGLMEGSPDLARLVEATPR